MTAEKTCEFILYFVLLMVYSGVFYLLGFDNGKRIKRILIA